MKNGAYDLRNIESDKLKILFKDALLHAYNVHIDKLDCNKSWRREATDEISVNEMIDRLTTKGVYIRDRSFSNYISKYGEITFVNDIYHLYIYLTLEMLYKFVDKHKLKLRDY